MRNITKSIVGAFLNRCPKSLGNTITNGNELFLHGNKIAEFRNGNELWITNAHWFSTTTKERLNALPRVCIFQKNHKWFLNGAEWNGEWTKVA